ncbi:hydroxyproline dehydrogenase-like [Amphiura filiformis]|uniref:hydroxyproline dehydrogenase-like n=1 Tax=Amphiura filiformis TaxID=82378 RepID=UPI003B20D1F0
MAYRGVFCRYNSKGFNLSIFKHKNPIPHHLIDVKIQPLCRTIGTTDSRHKSPYFFSFMNASRSETSAQQIASVFTTTTSELQQQQLDTEPAYEYYRQEHEEQEVVDFAKTVPERQFSELDFCQTEAAFEKKTTQELLRALVVLQLSSYGLIVDNSLKLMNLGQFILRKRLFDALMQATFFGQFAVSDAKSDDDLKETVRRFESAGIHPMILMTAEEDVGVNPGEFNEAMYNRNLDTMMRCLDLQASLCDATSYPLMSQLKVTSYIKADLLAKLTSLLKEKQLNFSNQTPMSYENCLAGMDGAMEVIPELTREEMAHLHTSMKRLNVLIKHSVNRGVKILVDAERTNINPGMTMLTLALMAKYNRQYPHIWNTYQCYLKSAYDNVLQSMAICEQGGFGFGAKIVRGAYMDHERNDAKKQNTEDPINPSWEATNDMYDKVTNYLLEYLHEHGASKCNVIIASHNEESVLKATQRMKDLGIPVTSTAAVFGQIYGMCDHVSYILGKAGYHMYKSIPFGGVNDVLPYLSRRAQENKTVFHRLTKEKHMIQEELGNRFRKGRTK